MLTPLEGLKVKLDDLNKTDVFYLASPYSTPMPEHLDLPENESGRNNIKDYRHEQVQRAGAQLMEKGVFLIEPIASSHFKAMNYNLPGNYAYWKDRDRRFIDIAHGTIVLLMNGWDQSVGVTDEIEYTKSLGKPVYGLSFNDNVIGVELQIL